MTNQIPVTKTLVFLNVAVFLAMVGFTHGTALLNPDGHTLLLFGASYGPLTLHGQLWRLVTCMFVHIGLLHIAMNMWCLWALGRLCEQIFGTAKYLAIYFITGIAGSVNTLLWSPLAVTAGASGAIFGLAGALLAILLVRKDLFIPAARSALLNNMMLFVFLNLAFSFAPGISMSAHMGGLLTGFVGGAAMSKFLK